MPNNYNSWRTGAQLDNIYPIGAVYISVIDTDPGLLFGGGWQRIENMFLLAAGSSYAAGDTGGKSDYVAADMPAHTHTRGTMEISGSMAPAHSSGVCWYNVASPTGAFYTSDSVTNCGKPSLSGNFTGDHVAQFRASRAWTGETSQSGTNSTATIMPPYLAVYMWKRVS